MSSYFETACSLPFFSTLHCQKRGQPGMRVQSAPSLPALATGTDAAGTGSSEGLEIFVSTRKYEKRRKKEREFFLERPSEDAFPPSSLDGREKTLTPSLSRRLPSPPSLSLFSSPPHPTHTPKTKQDPGHGAPARLDRRRRLLPLHACRQGARGRAQGQAVVLLTARRGG